MLEQYIRQRRQQKDILLMTHIVSGYPSFEHSLATVDAMVDAGVDLMELQIPFSEPMADGPVILRANAEALQNGAQVQQSIDFAAEVVKRHRIPFLFMSYYNILYAYGVERFVKMMADKGLVGAIVPDLPPEEGEVYLEAMDKHGLNPIQLFSPTTPSSRMTMLGQQSNGFVYCVARKGVTGSSTAFSEDIDGYLERCRDATELPLAVGFGVKSKEDVDFLKGKADIAVVGSATIRVLDEQGVDGVMPFIESLTS
ncbi:tryptophan synthase subunit alpha [Gammaproteobacteria bacterium]|nr:tryptophan synthase subunit alpha [Gammaproteobacteria bacterium]